MLNMHSGEQERARELITVTTVGTASQSDTFLLSWIHFQVKALRALGIKKPTLAAPGDDNEATYAYVEVF